MTLDVVFVIVRIGPRRRLAAVAGAAMRQEAGWRGRRQAMTLDVLAVDEPGAALLLRLDQTFLGKPHPLHLVAPFGAPA